MPGDVLCYFKTNFMRATGQHNEYFASISETKQARSSLDAIIVHAPFLARCKSIPQSMAILMSIGREMTNVGPPGTVNNTDDITSALSAKKNPLRNRDGPLFVKSRNGLSQQRETDNKKPSVFCYAVYSNLLLLLHLACATEDKGLKLRGEKEFF